MPNLTGNIKVILEGRGPVTLRPSDYLASGGEGAIYRLNQTVVKLYLDARKMHQENIAEKIKLLAQFQHPYVMSPEGLVTDPQYKPLGFYLPYAEGEPLARIFTTAFRQRQKFGDKENLILVERMREVVQFAHRHQAIMVDPNELNWLVYLLSKQGPEPRIIDVDSWSIGHWKARAIMPSIRDWHAAVFNELTDWFAWGIITFQVFTGIHPYKGHLDGFKNNDLEARMRANASVFLSEIRLNHAVRDFSGIPGPLLEWYKNTFQHGQRTIPPSPFEKITGKVATAAQIYRTVTTASGSLIFELLFKTAHDPAVRIWPCGVILLNSGTLIDLSSKKIIGQMASVNGELVKVTDGWLIADEHGGSFCFSYIDDRTFQPTPLSLSLPGYQLFRYENRLFITTANELVELKLMFAGQPILALGRRTAILQPKATRWFEGVGIQEALGAVFLVTPFEDTACTTLRLKELDGLRPVAAKAGHRFLAIVAADKNGDYHQLEIIPDKHYASYQLRQKNVDSLELNIAILPKGVCATIEDDGELTISVPTTGAVNKVCDKNIRTDWILANWENRVVYLDRGEVWSMRIR